uniref:WGS project CBMI000000000 data, contig CS3069_c001176 n=1 Tax=Fusarium clavum TaxID=2594811 RepID=A0A090MHL0_9HYPO|nr:unnamed protein product [Fusarium clavum]
MEIDDNIKNMTPVEKWLSISQAVVQGLIVLVEVSALGVEIAVSSGVALIGVQTAARALCCLATIGAVLGVLAIGVMIALFVYEATRPKPKPEAEKFADANKSLVDGLPKPPSILLDYTINPAEVPRSSAQDITVTLTNKTAKDVTLQQIFFCLNAGGDLGLFKGQEIVKQEWASPEGVPYNGVAVRFQASQKACGSDIFLDKKPEPASTVSLSGTILGQRVKIGQSPDSLLFHPGDSIKVLFKGAMVD